MANFVVHPLVHQCPELVYSKNGQVRTQVKRILVSPFLPSRGFVPHLIQESTTKLEGFLQLLIPLLWRVHLQIAGQPLLRLVVLVLRMVTPAKLEVRDLALVEEQLLLVRVDSCFWTQVSNVEDGIARHILDFRMLLHMVRSYPLNIYMLIASGTLPNG